ncbi:MAG: hypothetical protein CL677_07460 [Bdellovibrionaceae bacterium]|nr:hypothetical protein [Pseudobdellovibrionaceae bacterium]|tara:strand:+ start:49553 stop:49915 length:363 start_codon:yes stop_codon:yes gene_type:complete
MSRFSAWLSLFASTGTLLCCALPSLFVVLGMGATMAGLVSAVPQLVWISQYKAWVFAISGILISLAAFMHYRSRNEPCPIDPERARACASARKWSFAILTLSGSLWGVGAFFAFVAPLVL